MSEHTPGPWHVSDLDARTVGPRRVVRPDSLGDVPQLQAVARVMERLGETEANAHLIAAAPDLLAACKALLNDVDAGLLVRDITRDGEPGWAMHMLAFVQRLQAAQAAIAKAEGR